VLGSMGVAPFSTSNSAKGNWGDVWFEFVDDPESDFPNDPSSWRSARSRAGRVAFRALGFALLASAHNTPLRFLSVIERRSKSLALVDGA